MPIAVRPQFDWRLRTRSLALGPRTLLMGILNTTSDSFSDGGRFLTPNAALDHALQMLDDGADLLDLGGESTRPNATPITPAEEQARVLPILRAILAARPDAILSIDTYHAETARIAIDSGAEIVNDVSGLLWDDKMAETCASLACGAVLMHTRGRPREWRTLPALAPTEVLPLVLRDLADRTKAALAAGIARAAIVLDPGFGFGKSLDENYPLLAHLDTLHALGFPLLVGLSRKSFLARTPGSSSRTADPSLSSRSADPSLSSRSAAEGSASSLDSTTAATTAANPAAILGGAQILRVHDIHPARSAADLADRILTAASVIRIPK